MHTSQYALLTRPINCVLSLKVACALLLVNVAVAFLLLAGLEQHCGCENKSDVYADDTECTREDGIEEGVGKRGKGTNAADLIRSRERVCAEAVLDERR